MFLLKQTTSKGARTVRLFAVAALLTTLGAVPAARADGGGLGWPQAPGVAGDRDDKGMTLPETPDKPVLAPSRQLGIDLRAVPQVALAPVDTQALLREDDARAQRDMTKVLRFGIGRALSTAAADGNWVRLAEGGRLWVLDVVSSGALGVRLHLDRLRLPRGAQIAVYAPGNGASRAQAGAVTVYAGDQPSLGRAVWTPTVFGERARVEYYAPAGSGASLPFRIDRLQHLYLDPVRASFGKEAGPCHNDVTCYPEWADVAKAVGGISFVGTDSLYCTGQLISTVSQDRTPYYLTAHHCLSTQSDASSAEIFWLYQTATCGGAPPDITSVPRSEGATLEATGADSDYTLLLIDGVVPRRLFWVGWTAAPVATGTPSAVIHHPAGDYKRISFGDRAHNPVCGGNDVNHVRVNWTDGPTEPGSSGSGLFRDDTQQLYGQLHCGPSACGNETNDSFGAFAVTYPHIKAFLANGSDDILEENDSCDTARGVPAGTYRNLIVKSIDPDWYFLRVAPGKTLTVTLNFNQAQGDINARLYAGCDPTLLATASGSGNTETLTITNTGPRTVKYTWQVFLRNDTRNSYTMTVGVR